MFICMRLTSMFVLTLLSDSDRAPSSSPHLRCPSSLPLHVHSATVTLPANIGRCQDRTQAEAFPPCLGRLTVIPGSRQLGRIVIGVGVGMGLGGGSSVVSTRGGRGVFSENLVREG